MQTFRHSFATQLLEAHCGIHTVRRSSLLVFPVVSLPFLTRAAIVPGFIAGSSGGSRT